MAEQADVYVKNVLPNDINVVRELPDGSNDLNATVTNGSQERVYLAGTDVSLIINAPVGMDTKDCHLKVKSDIDLAVACSRTSARWKIKIEPDTFPPDVPTTVNVTVGDEEPG